MQVEESIIKVPGFSIALKNWHSHASRPILCLHGKMDNAASFDLLAPMLPNKHLLAVDYPGTGLSSHYPEGVLPHWKNDVLLLLHLIKILGWNEFDIIAHSLGALLATMLIISRPKQVKKLVLLDILGPTVNFNEQRIDYWYQDVETFLSYPQVHTVYPDKNAAIVKRMNRGKISYQAAEALVTRGTKKTEDGLAWTFDQRLRSIAATLPYEDELRAMLSAITIPVCLVRADHGVPYPNDIFQARAKTIKDLSIHEVHGGHHVHMDDPAPVAEIISEFL